MEEAEFARALLSHERRDWQDPEKIVLGLGLKKGMFVADIACGPGFFTVPIARAVGTGGCVYAVDSSKVMISYLSSNLRRSKVEDKVKIIKSDATKTGIPSSSVDVVFLANFLHDAKDFERALFSELKRISKKEASFVIIEWKKEETKNIGPEVKQRLSEKEAAKKLEDNGYKVAKRIKNAGPFHYGFICSQS